MNHLILRMTAITQQQFADLLNTPISRVQSIEGVKIKIKLTELEKISDSLDVSVDWLIDAEIDSQAGECLYLVWPEFCPDVKLYQRATSKRMAFLLMEQRLNKSGVRANTPRERMFVQLVGVHKKYCLQQELRHSGGHRVPGQRRQAFQCTAGQQYINGLRREFVDQLFVRGREHGAILQQQ